MRTDAALRFVRRHGIVLLSAKGAVPNLVEYVTGEPVSGSWWGHPDGHRIFRILTRVAASRDVLVCRLVAGKLTLVHRRLWPALVRLAAQIPRTCLAEERQQHTAAGNHVRRRRAFPAWVPRDVAAQAKRLAGEAARAELEPWIGAGVVPLRASGRQRG